MKLLTITIPCYNSEKYMHKCIESLLPGGEDVEILIVDDGSTDGTAAIADEYALKYPSIIRVIHKETEAMAQRSTPASKMPPGCISKWWTATTGCRIRPIGKSWISLQSLPAVKKCWIC